MALVTLRLGRVEQILQNLPVDGPLGNNTDENIRIVDDELFTNVIKRLDVIEAILADNDHIDTINNELKTTKELLIQTQLFNLKTDKKITDLEEKIAFFEAALQQQNQLIEDERESVIEETDQQEEQEEDQEVVVQE
jgi:hypothetical protein